MEIKRQAESKRDFVSPTTDLAVGWEEVPESPVAVIERPKRFSIRVGDMGSFGINDVAREQIADRLQIPRGYFGRLFADEAHHDLLTESINHFFRTDKKHQMLRTLDGNLRAYLSDRYRPLDNDELAEAILPILAGNPDFKIESSEITETRLYIKALFPSVEGEVRVGDRVQAGVCITNSEVGWGSLKVEPLVFRLACLNGMIAQDYSVRKMHLGGSAGGGDNAREFWRDDTRRISDEALMLQVRDTVTAVTRPESFETMLATFKETAERPITGDIPSVVEVTAKKVDLSDKETRGVLDALIRDGDLTQWGMANAITRHSQEVPSYDRATELERIGGVVASWKKSEWEFVASTN